MNKSKRYRCRSCGEEYAIGTPCDSPAETGASEAAWIKEAAKELYARPMIKPDCIAEIIRRHARQGQKRESFASDIEEMHKTARELAEKLTSMYTQMTPIPLSGIEMEIFKALYAADGDAWERACDMFNKVELRRAAATPIPEATERAVKLEALLGLLQDDGLHTRKLSARNRVRIVASGSQSGGTGISKPYWSWRWWVRWFLPLPILVWLSKRKMGNHHVWYQDEEINLETIGRGLRWNRVKK